MLFLELGLRSTDTELEPVVGRFRATLEAPLGSERSNSALAPAPVSGAAVTLLREASLANTASTPPPSAILTDVEVRGARRSFQIASMVIRKQESTMITRNTHNTQKMRTESSSIEVVAVAAVAVTVDIRCNHKTACNTNRFNSILPLDKQYHSKTKVTS